MRRWRTVTAGFTALALGAGLAIGGATSASAEPAGNWGTFTLSGASKAYTGTMTLPGFPATTFTSNSRQSTVISRGVDVAVRGDAGRWGLRHESCADVHEPAAPG
ncbi:hypothetical protein EDF48_106134 [Curtobacterium sp. PhB191]|uniref:hypothetical protein n=1 Tax=Curtobacterium sp. PhB191 TaxID=2485202 RepID=UPI001046A7F5|nr:hypothetical protein [Curtobacterium sp. PhB191]TCU84315.1 hypothetical protein EDF48_106134 [Curtobacterium sp. PhB191]